jgi:hypothetical protein
LIDSVVCLAPRHTPSSEPEETAWKSSLDLEDVADKPNKEIADVTRRSASHNEQSLLIVWIAEESDTITPDRDALPKG